MHMDMTTQQQDLRLSFSCQYSSHTLDVANSPCTTAMTGMLRHKCSLVNTCAVKTHACKHTCALHVLMSCHSYAKCSLRVSGSVSIMSCKSAITCSALLKTSCTACLGCCMQMLLSCLAVLEQSNVPIGNIVVFPASPVTVSSSKQQALL